MTIITYNFYTSLYFFISILYPSSSDSKITFIRPPDHLLCIQLLYHKTKHMMFKVSLNMFIIIFIIILSFGCIINLIIVK